jgi:hypothetical protein
MLQDFKFKIVHKIGSRHLNVNALNMKPNQNLHHHILVIIHTMKLSLICLPYNLSTKKTIDEELHHLGDEEKNVHYSSKEKLQRMNHEDYRMMVVEAQIMVD